MHPVDLPKQIVVHFCERKGPVVGLAMIGWDSSSIFRCLKPVKYKINVHILKMYMYAYTHTHTHTHTVLSIVYKCLATANDWSVDDHRAWTKFNQLHDISSSALVMHLVHPN